MAEPLGGQIPAPTIFDATLAVLIDVHPDLFPDGVQLAVTKGLELLGTAQIPRGAIVAMVPPEMAEKMRALITKPPPGSGNGLRAGG